MKNNYQKYIRIVGLCLLAAIAGTTANAQQKPLELGLQYNYSFPAGNNFKNDLISNSSARGFNADLMYHFTDNIAGGIGFGMQDYYQRYDRAVYKTGPAETVSAVLTNSLQVMPFVLQGRYIPTSSNTSLFPYVQVGVGAGAVSDKQYLGEFSSTINKIKFMGTAGAGVHWRLSSRNPNSIALSVGGDFRYLPYNENGVKTLNTWNAFAGVVVPLK